MPSKQSPERVLHSYLFQAEAAAADLISAMERLDEHDGSVTTENPSTTYHIQRGWAEACKDRFAKHRRQLIEDYPHLKEPPF